MRIEIQCNPLFPLSMPYVTTLQYREIFWQNGSLLYGSDTAKQEFFMRLQLRLQSLHKHDFISNQLLFYCWLTQQHFNFSVSFSFNWSKESFSSSKHAMSFMCQLVSKENVILIFYNMVFEFYPSHLPAVFPQLKYKFPGMNSEFSRNLSQFPETEEGHIVLVRCPQKFKICTTSFT